MARVAHETMQKLCDASRLSFQWTLDFYDSALWRTDQERACPCRAYRTIYKFAARTKGRADDVQNSNLSFEAIQRQVSIGLLQSSAKSRQAYANATWIVSQI